jgi:hypothetical protein
MYEPVLSEWCLYDFPAAYSSWLPDTGHPSVLKIYKVHFNIILVCVSLCCQNGVSVRFSSGLFIAASWHRGTFQLFTIYEAHFNFIIYLSLRCPNGVFLYDLPAACSSRSPDTGYPSVLKIYKMHFNIIIWQRASSECCVSVWFSSGFCCTLCCWMAPQSHFYLFLIAQT